MCDQNRRPISLLNNNAKIFVLVFTSLTVCELYLIFMLLFTKALKLGLTDVIDEEQSGIMPGPNTIEAQDLYKSKMNIYYTIA